MQRVVAISADHAGEPLVDLAHSVCASLSLKPIHLARERIAPADDYPDFAQAVARAIQRGTASRGIVICGSGVGASVAANKFRGVRAAVCHDTYSASQVVSHDDMNVLCLGARIIGTELARAVITAYLTATFSGEERHARRLAKIKAFEDHWAD